jgi:hypothetical protein
MSFFITFTLENTYIIFLNTKSKKLEFEDQFSELGTLISFEAIWILSIDIIFF